MDNTVKVSIAIPTYEMRGVGPSLLKQCFEGIQKQSYTNIEVVISDHSRDESIYQICQEFSNLNIVYVKNELKRGNFAHNLNVAIRKCTGQIIKLLMQDDYLSEDNSIQSMVTAFEQNPDKMWLAAGCKFGYDGGQIHSMIPQYSDQIIRSVNTIGSPSTVAIRNIDPLQFDETMSWVVDLDYYKKLYNSFGLPIIVNEYLVFVRQHGNQISTTLSEMIKQQEQDELFERYK